VALVVALQTGFPRAGLLLPDGPARPEAIQQKTISVMEAASSSPRRGIRRREEDAWHEPPTPATVPGRTAPPPLFVIGVMKSGTTALCDSLAKHPSIATTRLLPDEPNHYRKELHHFDSKERHSNGLDFYYEHFPAAGKVEGGLGSTYVDCTPTYLGHQHAAAGIAQAYGARACKRVLPHTHTCARVHARACSDTHVSRIARPLESTSPSHRMPTDGPVAGYGPLTDAPPP
jgi:hypothetical protein